LNVIITERQLDVACEIRAYRHRRGIGPTLAELAGRLGVSVVTIFGHVGELERKGVVTRDRRRSRSLEIVRPELLPPMVRNTVLRVLGTIG
jgi:DNA-binding MarR family transcriptional regulator